MKKLLKVLLILLLIAVIALGGLLAQLVSSRLQKAVGRFAMQKPKPEDAGKEN